MRAQITHVRFHGYRKHEDIAVYRWRLESGESGESDRPAMLRWLEQGNDAVIAMGGVWAAVGVVRMPGAEAFLCAHLNGQWTDGMLDLPMF